MRVNLINFDLPVQAIEAPRFAPTAAPNSTSLARR